MKYQQTKAPELPHYLAFVARFVLVDSATVLAQIQTALAEWAASQGLGLLDGLLKFWLANVRTRTYASQCERQMGVLIRLTVCVHRSKLRAAMAFTRASRCLQSLVA